MIFPDREKTVIIPESPNNLQLQAALQETLERASQAGIDLYLTGGTAAASYAGEKRPLSLDLDFFIAPENADKVQATFGGEFVYFGSKKLFKSNKLVAQTSNGVDLDFIEMQSIVPNEEIPDKKIVLRLTETAKTCSMPSDFMGIKVQVLPPEYVVIAKLFAGRGIDLGKFDILDSESIINTGIIRTPVFIKVLAEIIGESSDVFDLVIERLNTGLAKTEEDTPKIRELKEAISSLTHPEILRIQKETAQQTHA